MNLDYSDAMTSKEKAQELLALAGITINGKNPWDMQVHDERLYSRVFAYGSLGLGEAYMDGWWDAEALDELFARALNARIDTHLKSDPTTILYFLRARFFNWQTRKRALQVGEEHYDIGNDLFERMLDTRMVYSCGYWSGTPPAGNLEEAQEAKLDLVCRKLGLKAGQRVLDIGCGWGSFAKFAAERYGVSVVGITISKEQVSLAQKTTAGLPVEIRLQDYREVKEQFDAIVSIGMFEHVGVKNYPEYMRTVARCLKDDGLFLLHTIGTNESVSGVDPWIHTYIFPNGMLPGVRHIAAAIEKHFVMEDWHSFGVDYDRTTMEWLKKFETAWPDLQGAYSERFRRMWRFYLCGAAANFRLRHNQLWQIVLSKNGVEGGYKSIR